MALASSNISNMRLPWLWSPAKASVLFSDHGIMSVRQVFSCPLDFTVSEVAPSSYQWELMAERAHLASSGHVLVRSWSKVLAVRTTLQSSQVDMAQLMTIAVRADLPTP